MAPRKVKASELPDDDPKFTRTLPHNLEAEKSLIGAVLINNAAFERAAQWVKSRDFFRHAHREIWTACATLLERNAPADLLTVKDELLRSGMLDECGGPAYVSGLTDGVPRSSNAVAYAKIVREKSVLRQIITAANDMLMDAYDAEKPGQQIINDADRAIIALQRGSEPGRLLDLRETSAGLYADLEQRDANKGKLLGIETGFPSINDLTLGWQRGDLIVIAARPSIGKTAFTLNATIAAARAGHTVAVFSLEMRRRQLEYRMLSTLAGIDLTRLQAGYLGELDFERLGPAMAEMGSLPIYIDDRGSQTVGDIRSACRLLRAEHGLDLVVIDYIQLIAGSLDRRGSTRNEEVTDISRRLKVLADEVQAPVLVLSQLNRASETRGDHRPRLTDLRESGALEQDADIVAFLHRKNHRESGTTAFIVEKQRNGPTGTTNLTLDRPTQTFTDGGEEPPADPAPPAGERKPRKARPPRVT